LFSLLIEELREYIKLIIKKGLMRRPGFEVPNVQSLRTFPGPSAYFKKQSFLMHLKASH